MSWGLHRLLAASIPYLPKGLVGLFARRYVAGEAAGEALAVARDLNRQGFETTLDILGEHVASEHQAAMVAQQYADLYGEISRQGLEANISLKPTHLGLDLGRQICEAKVFQVLDEAQATDNFLRLDMEDIRYTDDTLALYRKCRARHAKVGPVLQACLRRSGDDLAALLSPQLNVRLCKGIYLESPEVAIQDRHAINANFLKLVRQGFAGGGYLAIATHDQRLIAEVESIIRDWELSPDRFEFQVLYGVPMAGKLQRLRDQGFKVRIYIPFGETWYDYSLRRLQENPAILRYVLRNLFRR